MGCGWCTFGICVLTQEMQDAAGARALAELIGYAQILGTDYLHGFIHSAVGILI